MLQQPIFALAVAHARSEWCRATVGNACLSCCCMIAHPSCSALLLIAPRQEGDRPMATFLPLWQAWLDLECPPGGTQKVWPSMAACGVARLLAAYSRRVSLRRGMCVGVASVPLSKRVSQKSLGVCKPHRTQDMFFVGQHALVPAACATSVCPALALLLLALTCSTDPHRRCGLLPWKAKCGLFCPGLPATTLVPCVSVLGRASVSLSVQGSQPLTASGD